MRMGRIGLQALRTCMAAPAGALSVPPSRYRQPLATEGYKSAPRDSMTTQLCNAVATSCWREVTAILPKPAWHKGWAA